MKKVMLLACAFVLLFQAAAFAETKIGVIVLPQAVMNSEYGKEMQAQLKAKFEPMQKELEREAADLKKLETEIKNQDLALKLDAKQDRQREFRRKLRDLQDSKVAFTRKLKEENNKLRQPILGKLKTVLNKYAKDNGYTMIIQAAAGVLYIEEGMDITQDIIVALDKFKKEGK